MWSEMPLPILDLNPLPPRLLSLDGEGCISESGQSRRSCASELELRSVAEAFALNGPLALAAECCELRLSSPTVQEEQSFQTLHHLL